MDKLDQLGRMHKKLGSSPIIMWILGGSTLWAWLAVTIVQIQTSEYLASGSTSVVAGVSWSVFQQPVLVITGQAPIQLVTAWSYGWIVELITLIFAMALGVAVVKIRAVNPLLATLFVAVGVPLLLLNGWADFASSPGSNPLVKALIALAIGGIAMVGLPLGIGLLEHGYEEFQHA